MAKVEPGVANLLAQVAAMGLTDQAVHERVPLPSGWLSQARSGRYPTSSGTCKRLAAWLDRIDKSATPSAPDLRATIVEAQGLVAQLRQILAEVRFCQDTVRMQTDALLSLFGEARRLGIATDPPEDDVEDETAGVAESREGRR